MADGLAASHPIRVELKINGTDVPLNDFVQSFLVGTLTGMLRSLHGVDQIRTVDLKIVSETH